MLRNFIIFTWHDVIQCQSPIVNTYVVLYKITG